MKLTNSGKVKNSHYGAYFRPGKFVHIFFNRLRSQGLYALRRAIYLRGVAKASGPRHHEANHVLEEYQHKKMGRLQKSAKPTKVYNIGFLFDRISDDVIRSQVEIVSE